MTDRPLELQKELSREIRDSPPHPWSAYCFRPLFTVKLVYSHTGWKEPEAPPTQVCHHPLPLGHPHTCLPQLLQTGDQMGTAHICA